jgi:hypothetical protein
MRVPGAWSEGHCVMASYFETLAFALLIGGQFLGAVVLIAKRDSSYGDVRQPERDRDQSQLANAFSTA